MWWQVTFQVVEKLLLQLIGFDHIRKLRKIRKWQIYFMVLCEMSKKYLPENEFLIVLLRDYHLLTKIRQISLGGR